MPRYIDADKLIEELQPAKNAEWNKNDHSASRSEMIEDFCTELKNAPAADVVEIETLRKWLYEIAINNVGCVLDGDFSTACEEIISRLDGLRKFAQEKGGE